MRKLILRLLPFVILLGLFTPVQAKSPHQQRIDSPADLFPENTWFYAEFSSQYLSTDFDPWVGERLGIGIYTNAGFIPEVALVLEVRDDAAAAEFAKDLPGIRTIPGYLVIGSELETSPVNLSTNPNFTRVQNALSNSPTAWAYVPFGGIALYTDDVFSLETVWLGNPPSAGVRDPLTDEMLAGVPQDAFVVVAGTDISLRLQQFGEISQVLFEFLGDLLGLPEMANFSDSFFRTALGVDYEREFLPLFDGGYAGFLTFGSGSVYEIPIDGGFILSPEDSTNAIFTANTMNNRLEQLGLPITRISATQFSLETGGIDLFYGFSGGQLYFSTESGAEEILATLDGRNITDTPIWERTVEYAPQGTQQMTYINLQLAAGFINTERNAIQHLAGEFVELLQKYESLAIFNRTDENGTRTSKWVLLTH